MSSDLSREEVEAMLVAPRAGGTHAKCDKGVRYLAAQLLRTMGALKAAEDIARDVKQQSLDRGSLLVDAVARAEKAEAALGEAADTYRLRADSLKLARENEDRIREARALDREAMEAARKAWPQVTAVRWLDERLRPEPKPAGCHDWQPTSPGCFTCSHCGGTAVGNLESFGSACSGERSS